jgi:hypothetical protein
MFKSSEIEHKIVGTDHDSIYKSISGVADTEA